MLENKEKVLLLKAPNEDKSVDPYQEELEKAGFQVSLIPVIQFNFVSSDLLEEKMKNPSEYSAIVLTSKRAVEAVKNACADQAILDKWKGKPVYVVGQATSRAVQTLLALHTIGAESGSAEVLANCIKNDMKGPGKILFPKGNLAKDTLGNILESHGISVDHIVVYDTVPNQNLEKLLEDEQLPDWVVFFSPSGANVSLPIIERVHHENLDKVRLVAIGPTTQKEIENLGFEVFKVAEKPTPEAINHALLDD